MLKAPNLQRRSFQHSSPPSCCLLRPLDPWPLRLQEAKFWPLWDIPRIAGRLHLHLGVVIVMPLRVYNDVVWVPPGELKVCVSYCLRPRETSPCLPHEILCIASPVSLQVIFTVFREGCEGQLKRGKVLPSSSLRAKHGCRNNEVQQCLERVS